MKSFISFCSIFSLAVLISSCDISSDVPSYNQQLAEDVADLDAYLSSKSITALKDFRGIRFTIDSPATTILTGYPARLTDEVRVKYKGKLTNGFIFDEQTAVFNPQTLVAGFQIGLSMVPIGSKATLYIPAVLGYGNQARSGIPANSHLIFEIKVISTKPIASEKTKKAADITTIETQLNANAIAFQSDTSGLRYQITQTGLGNYPTVFNKVKIKFIGRLFLNGAKFFEGDILPGAELDSRIVHYVRGLQLGLIKLNKGAKAVFYIPSPLALGTRSDFINGVSIPANSILQYEIEMLDILDP